MAFNKLLRTVRKLKRNQVTSILTRSQMGLNAFQSPMHEWRREKIVIGKNTCCNLSLLSCFPHCPGGTLPFCLYHTERPGWCNRFQGAPINSVKQAAGRERPAIDNRGSPEWMGLLVDLCVQLLPSPGSVVGTQGHRQALGKASCVKAFQGQHCYLGGRASSVAQQLSLWPAVASGEPWSRDCCYQLP